MTLREKLLQHPEVKTREEGLDLIEQIVDKFAIGFAEWLLIIYNEDIIYDAYSKEELLEIYKKEKGL